MLQTSLLAQSAVAQSLSAVAESEDNSAPAADPPQSPSSSYLSDAQAPSDAQLDSVAQHFKADILSPELIANFRLFVYVDKAQNGSFAQRMYVFERTASGDIALTYDWPVSTGRERMERDKHGHVESSLTPAGYYELDPKRFFVNYASAQWHEAMPYAMFFDWKPKGHETGLAIHGAAGDDADDLGARASAGCVRLSLDHAKLLFNLVRSQFRGPAPKIAYLDGDISSEGLLLHDQDGRLKMADGYSVLVVIDNFSGEDRVTSLF